jgi:hypothetical protein
MITNRPYTSLFIEEGGWTLYTTDFRANSANIANNRSTKLETLICSAHARTVRPTGAGCPDRGLSGLRTLILVPNTMIERYNNMVISGAPCLFFTQTQEAVVQDPTQS